MATLSTFADLLDHLGGIPSERARRVPLPGTGTEQDVLDIEAKENSIKYAIGYDKNLTKRTGSQFILRSFQNFRDTTQLD